MVSMQILAEMEEVVELKQITTKPVIEVSTQTSVGYAEYAALPFFESLSVSLCFSLPPFVSALYLPLSPSISLSPSVPLCVPISPYISQYLPTSVFILAFIPSSPTTSRGELISSSPRASAPPRYRQYNY